MRSKGLKNGPISANNNVAAAAVNIDGMDPQMLTSVSGGSARTGTVPEVGVEGNPQRFLPGRMDGGANTRFSDTEFKILNYLANQIGPSSDSVTGSVWLHSDFPVCDSCNGVIDQFRSAFPNVDLRVTSGGSGP